MRHYRVINVTLLFEKDDDEPILPTAIAAMETWTAENRRTGGSPEAGNFVVAIEGTPVVVNTTINNIVTELPEAGHAAAH